jgi:hypothetical protein
VGPEQVDEVGVQAAALEAAGGVGRQQPGDALLAGLGLAVARSPVPLGKRDQTVSEADVPPP